MSGPPPRLLRHVFIALGLARAAFSAPAFTTVLTASSSTSADVLLTAMGHTSESGGSIPTREAFWFTIALILFLVMLGGLFAGLTLGLLSLDLMALEVLEQSGSERERRYAKRIKPIRQRGHWLLVTLLLSNVIVNETLPILTDSVWSGGWPAVVISSTLIVIFGEVIPQAVCSRYGLRIGATFAGFVWLLMVVLSPVAWPLAKLLDSILGEAEGTTYKRAELKALVSLHEHSEQHFGPLSNDEVTIIKAVLDLRDKSVASIMTPLEHVYMLNWDDMLDECKVLELVEKGHSRVPVFAGTDRRNIIGMLLVKKLVSYEPSERRKVKEFVQFIHSVPVLEPNANCYDVLNLFQEGRSHLAVIVDDDPRLIRAASFGVVEPESRPVLNVLGIITLEDVIEELIGEEIIDETDLYVDVTRQDLVRRFKSPKVGPSATPRLGPMPQPTAASAASMSHEGRTLRPQQPSGLPLRRTLSSMSGIPSLTTPLLGPSNPQNGPATSSHVTTFDYGSMVPVPHHADSAADSSAKTHLQPPRKHSSSSRLSPRPSMIIAPTAHSRSGSGSASAPHQDGEGGVGEARSFGGVSSSFKDGNWMGSGKDRRSGLAVGAKSVLPVPVDGGEQADVEDEGQGDDDDEEGDGANVRATARSSRPLLS